MLYVLFILTTQTLCTRIDNYEIRSLLAAAIAAAASFLLGGGGGGGGRGFLLLLLPSLTRSG